MGSIIAYIDEDVQCPKCKYEFTTTLALDSSDWTHALIKCKRCDHQFRVRLKDELLKEHRIAEQYAGEWERYAMGTRKDFAYTYGRGCGNCGKKVTQGYCHRCNKWVTEYVEPYYRAPASLKNTLYVCVFTGAIFFGMMMLSLFRLGDPYLCLSGLGLLCASVALAFFYHSKIDRIKKTGYVLCSKCRQEVSAKSRFCIYCGRRAF